MFVTEEDLKINPKLKALIAAADKKAEIVLSRYSKGKPTVIEFDEVVYGRGFKVNPQKSIYIFDITPIGKPRMTRRDKWAKTRTVAASKYMAWRNQFELLIADQKFEIGDGVQVVFLLPFKKNWSKEKCEQMRGMPHQEKPDADNMLKGFIDVLCKADQRIYDKHPLKFWWDTGKIIVVRNIPLYKSLMEMTSVYEAIKS